jgi:protocatechuate 3,4-dioxygenase beta subunit
MRPRVALACSLVLAGACRVAPTLTPTPAPPIATAEPAPTPVPTERPAPTDACPGWRAPAEGPVALMVVDLRGRPIAGAEVTTAIEAGETVQRERLVADADGRLTVPSDARLLVSASGFVARDHLHAATLDPPRVHLLPASTIAGRVRDAATGAPLAGAELVAQRHLGGSSRPDGRTTSDADGRFRVTGLAPGRYYVVAADDRHRGHRGVAVGLGESVADLDVPAHRLVRVEGRVLAANGSTCTSGQVTLHVGNPAGGGCNCAGEPDTVTSGLDPKTGAARFLLAPDQTYGVEAYCDDHLITTLAPIAIRRRDIRGLTWRVRRGLTVRGRIVDEAGAPLADVDVDAKYDPDDRGYDSVARAGASTDANGEFTLSGLAPGNPEILVTGYTDRGDYFGDTVIELGPGDLTGLEIAAEFNEHDDEPAPARCEVAAPKAELHGVVIDAAGAPVPHAVVVRYNGRAPSDALAALARWNDAAVLTDERGAYHLPVDPREPACKGGRCSDVLVAYRIGGGEGSIATPAVDDAPAEIRIGPRATITGTLKAARGRPVTAFGTTLDQNTLYPAIDYQYDPAGAFELPGVLPGSYLLGAHTTAGDGGRRITVDAGQRLHVDLVVARARDE